MKQSSIYTDKRSIKRVSSSTQKKRESLHIRIIAFKKTKNNNCLKKEEGDIADA